MFKNHVAATPANYALWYTYVDKTIPELNQELDMVLQNYDVCPPATHKMLYNSYVASKAETSLEELKTNVGLLLGEVSSSMSDTITDTSYFSELIDRSFNKLEKVEDHSLSIEEVMSVVRQLVSESLSLIHI